MATTSSTSWSVQEPVNTPQSDWMLQLSQLLGQLGLQQYNWALQQYDQLSGITDDMINRYITASDKALGMAGYDLDRYRNIFQPIEDQLIADAGSYASGARTRANMGRAEAGVMQSGDRARVAAEKQLQSFGINPSSGRYADLIASQRAATAAAAAGAGNEARLATEQTGRGLRQQALAIGQQYPGQIVNALNAAYTGVSGAENAALGRANAGVNLTTSPAAFFNPAMQLKYPPLATRSGSSSSGGSGSGGGGGGGGDKNKPPTGGGGNSGPPIGAPGPRNDPLGRGLLQGTPGRFGKPDPRVIENDEDKRGETGFDYDPSYLPQWAQPYLGTWDPMTPPGQNTYDFPTWNGNPSVGEIPAGGGLWGQPQNVTQFPTPDPAQVGWQPNASSPWVGEQQPYYTPPEQAPEGLWPTPPAQQTSWDFGYDVDNLFSGMGEPQTRSFAGTDYTDPYTTGGGGTDYFDDAGGEDYDSYGGYYGGYAKGGGVLPGGNKPATSGGFVSRHLSPSGGQMTDDIPARLNADEFVIPRDVAMWKGQEFFWKLIEQSRKARGMSQQQPADQGDAYGQ